MEDERGIRFNDKFKAYCFDCAQKDIETRIEIKDKKPVNGQMMTYNVGEEEHLIFKCGKCFEDNPKSIMVAGQACEVYSRIVGYLRPISQWHKGKQEEYGDRVNYKMDYNNEIK